MQVRAFERYISLNENPSRDKGKGDMEPTSNLRINRMTFNCDVGLVYA